MRLALVSVAVVGALALLGVAGHLVTRPGGADGQTATAAFAASSAARAEPQTITWETLAPKTGPAIVIDVAAPRTGNVAAADFDGSKEDYEFFLEDLEIMRDMQPEGGKLNAALDGKQVRIAGYVTPVGFDDTDVVEFLFVPFLGACSHVPPPHANQIIHVKNAKGIKTEDLWRPMWLNGTLRAQPVATVLADVGYRMDSAVVEPYDGTAELIEDPIVVD